LILVMDGPYLNLGYKMLIGVETEVSGGIWHVRETVARRIYAGRAAEPSREESGLSTMTRFGPT